MMIEPSWLFWIAPAAYLLGGLLVIATPTRAWRIAQASVAVALGATLAAAVLVAWRLAVRGHGADLPGLTVALLVTFLGWVITRYSQRYLDGERGQVPYAATLLLTLATVVVTVLTHHLGLLVAAWSATSLGLHRLLTFYRHRPAAQIVAHKKFLVSRLAELCLVTALVLVFQRTGTLELDAILQHAETLRTLPWQLQAAAVLIAIAALLKCAQLPVHGWLIQVMEAPTPVSALLHAGIVNIAGFVLIRLGTLIAAVPTAQGLLVVVGSLTAALAGLVMMTRISIKVRLAWSTCAQMGFMLMECGLGLYDLALLHLVAHSIYKAYAFLSAGETVVEARRRDFAPRIAAQPASVALLRRLVAAPIAGMLVVASSLAWTVVLPSVEIPAIGLVILAFGLAPLLWDGAAQGPEAALRGGLRVLALTQLYVIWHLAFGRLAPVAAAPSLPLAVWAGLCLATLYGIQTWVQTYPSGRLSAALYPWAYAGFYLDERFTRFVFRVWPVPRPAARLVNTDLPDCGVPGEHA